MGNNQVNGSSNGAIVAIALAVITSLTSLGTTFISSKEDSKENSKETIEKLDNKVKLLKKRIDELEGKYNVLNVGLIQLYNSKKELINRVFNNEKNLIHNDMFILLIDSLDEKTRSVFFNKVNFKNSISSNFQHKSLSDSLKPISDIKDTVFSKLKL